MLSTCTFIIHLHHERIGGGSVFLRSYFHIGYIGWCNCVVEIKSDLRQTFTRINTNSYISWWRHEMETFSALLAICAINSPVPGEFPAQRPVTSSFDVFFDLRLNKWLSKQSWGWWFETLSRPLWRHWNVNQNTKMQTVDHFVQASVFWLASVLHKLIRIAWKMSGSLEYARNLGIPGAPFTNMVLL